MKKMVFLDQRNVYCIKLIWRIYNISRKKRDSFTKFVEEYLWQSAFSKKLSQFDLCSGIRNKDNKTSDVLCKGRTLKLLEHQQARSALTIVMPLISSYNTGKHQKTSVF